MAMTTDQGELWKKITQVYYQWDPDGSQLMPVKNLNDMLPAVPSEMIRETLMNAKESRMAEFENAVQGGSFRPLQH
jgi:hypothetical protein